MTRLVPLGGRSVRLGLQAGALLAIGGSVLPAALAMAQDAGAEQVAAETREAGRELFREWGWIQRHALSDAGSTSGSAPSLDANANLSRSLVLERLTRGQGDMPAFAGLISDQEMEVLAQYLTTVGKGAQAGTR